MRLRAIVLLFALTGCADDYASVFITGVATPTVEEGGCTFDPNTHLLTGVYDVSGGATGGGLRAPYILALAVENSLFPRENALGAEPNGVFITDAVVTITDTNGGGTLDEYRVPASGYIAPGATDVVTVEAITNTTPIDAGSSVLVLEISLIGHTQGEIDIETGAFRWPVSVCSGCLYRCVDGEVDDTPGLCTPGSNFVLESSCL